MNSRSGHRAPIGGPSIITFGASMGGVRALEIVLSALDEDFPTPVALVLHRHARSGSILVKQIQRSTRLPVCEPEDKQPVAPGVYVAPADYHLIVERGWFGLSVDPPENHARPSVDVLFESAVHAYGARVLGIVLTGANRDGARGTALIRQHGGSVIAQDPDTAEAPQMPTAAIAAGADIVLALADIGPHLLNLGVHPDSDDGQGAQ
jgi:two-component system chemotaxis response regulator CheB